MPLNFEQRVIYRNIAGKEIFIYLPRNYNESKKKYPVIYMHDGQNLLANGNGSFGQWGIDNVLDKLVDKRNIQEIIIVGINNNGEERIEDYVPYTVDNIFKKGGIIEGRGEEYARLVVEDIVPYIDSHFRTSTIRGDRGVIGSSLGGLISLWIIMNYPDKFKFVGALSPCAPWIVKDLKKFPHRDIKIWIDAGTDEITDINYDYLKSAHKFVDILIERGYKYGQDLFFYQDSGGVHKEVAWGRRIKYPFILFKNQPGDKFTKIIVNVDKVCNIKTYEKETYINPVLIFNNGFKYSLYRECKYYINNSKAVVSKRGLLKFNGEKKVDVSIDYNGIVRKVRVENHDQDVLK